MRSNNSDRSPSPPRTPDGGDSSKRSSRSKERRDRDRSADRAKSSSSRRSKSSSSTKSSSGAAKTLNKVKTPVKNVKPQAEKSETGDESEISYAAAAAKSALALELGFEADETVKDTDEISLKIFGVLFEGDAEQGYVQSDTWDKLMNKVSVEITRLSRAGNYKQLRHGPNRMHFLEQEHCGLIKVRGFPATEFWTHLIGSLEIDGQKFRAWRSLVNCEITMQCWVRYPFHDVADKELVEGILSAHDLSNNEYTVNKQSKDEDEDGSRKLTVKCSAGFRDQLLPWQQSNDTAIYMIPYGCRTIKFWDVGEQKRNKVEEEKSVENVSASSKDGNNRRYKASGAQRGGKGSSRGSSRSGGSNTGGAAGNSPLKRFRTKSLEKLSKINEEKKRGKK